MTRIGGALAVVLAALLVPPFLSPYLVHLLVLMLFFAFLGVAWNLLGGYAGQFSFGHAAFFGIGAYTSTLLLVRLGLSPWLGLPRGRRPRRPVRLLRRVPRPSATASAGRTSPW